MPFYNTATAAAALEVSPKWLDNLLSHNELDGIAREPQGVARRLPLTAILVISLARELIDTTGLSAPSALKLADRLLNSSSQDGPLSPVFTITVNRDALQSTLLRKLARAVETAPTPRRGRPPTR
ncbi:MAG: hypothetical protein ABI328_04450 [Gemmatimonadaceae bacterium]